jgi:methyl-accepting chemotaxis protein
MNVRQLRIGARLALGFGLVMAMLVAALAASLVANHRLRTDLQHDVGTASAKERASGEMRAALFEAAVAMRNVVLESEVAAFQKQADRARAMDKRYVQAREAFVALKPTSEEQGLLARIGELEKQVARPFSQAVQLAAAMDGENATKLIATQVEPLQVQQIALINELQALQVKHHHDAVAEGEAKAATLLAVLATVALVAAGIGAAVAFACTRSITRPLGDAVAVAQRVSAGDLSHDVHASGRDEAAQLLQALAGMTQQLRHMVGRVRDGSDSIATGSSEIATGNGDLSQRTEQQASSLQQTAASMESLTEVVRHNADNARRATTLARGAAQVASEGGTVVREVIETMDKIAQSSHRIADITAVIDGIAFQTNILALNAAVEAARAGEQGRGFAVVASEVRALAQRSAAAAREIKDLIASSVQTVEAGSTLVDKAGHTMTAIVDQVHQVSTLIGEISGSTEHQSGAIGEVRDAVSQLDGVTQQNAALVEQSAAAAESLRLQAAELARLVAAFKLDQQHGAALMPA